MPLTHRDIETVTFSKPPIGKRGYNEDEVDAFLDLLVVDVAEYERTIDDQAAEITDLRNTPVATPEPVQQILPPAPPPPATPEPPSAIAARILEAAERTADEVARQAEQIADKAVREAQEKASEIMAEARYEASKLVETARREAEEIEERLAGLRRFEENYRGRLDTYIDSQLHALRADGKIEPQS